MNILIRLFLEFFKTGLFAIGGGLATLPFLYDISRRTGWYTTSDISDMVAVSESTPGPMGVNMSTYTGFRVAGILGAVVATLSLVLPSLIIIILVARILNKYKDSRYVKGFMYGIRPASIAMICMAGLMVAKLAFLPEGSISIKAVIFGLVVLAAYIKFKWHPIFYVLAAAAVGVVFRF